MKKPTVKDVALEAGVSVATVSRVINNIPGFSLETGKRVQDAMEKLGYRFNAVARDLRTTNTYTIATLVPEVESTIYAKILAGIQNMAKSAGYCVLVCHIGADGCDLKEYIDLLEAKRVEGIIGCSIPPTEEFGQIIEASQIPTVLVSTLSPNGHQFSYIKVDDFNAAYSATSYLIRNGHKQIAMISGKLEDKVSGAPRYEGYKAALRDYNLKINEDLIEFTNFSYDEGVIAARKLFKKKEKFTAIVTCSDNVAAAVNMVAREECIRIPEDISVVGYDNTIIAEITIPPLTTVNQPLYEMGQRSFELLEKIWKGCNPEAVIMPFSICERSSVQSI